MKRREFIKLVGVGWILFLTKNKLKIFTENRFIRPPGAIEEEFFIYMCIRCGKCVKICPAKCLKPVPLNKGILEWGTPHIIPREKGCILCFECGKVCPTGAIGKVKFGEFKMGSAEINIKRCLVWVENKDCFVCMEVCPVGAIFKNEKDKPIVDKNICVGCGQCEKNCPVIGESAIKVKNIDVIRKRLKRRKYV